MFSPPCLELLRETILEAGGNEVFFLAKPDAQRQIVEVTPLARGNDSAVPALMQVATQGDVIIHNHPSGHLTPSPADVSIASEYGNQGVGFYIVNNTVDEIYVVVEAFQRQKLQQLQLSEMVELISEKGGVARKLRKFESRPEQQQDD